MMINGKSIGIASVLAAIVLLGSAMKVFGVEWKDVGWMSESRHVADIEAIRTETTADKQDILDAIKGLSKQESDNHMEWLCDEDKEELIELLEKDERGLANVEDIERIRKLRDNLDNRTCGEE